MLLDMKAVELYSLYFIYNCRKSLTSFAFNYMQNLGVFETDDGFPTMIYEFKWFSKLNVLNVFSTLSKKNNEVSVFKRM